MANKFEVIENALVVTDTVGGGVLFDAPLKDTYYITRDLDNGNIVLFDTSGVNKNSSEIFKVPLAGSIDSNDIQFTESTFRDFARLSLGKSSAQEGAVDSDSAKWSGWAQYGDSNYTNISPLVVNSGQTSTINLDGLLNTVKTQLPEESTDLYNTVSSKITPVSSGDGYSMSLAFNGISSSNNGDATIFVDIGGSFTRLFPKTFRFNRGAGVSHEYYFVFNFYSLGTFIANGGLIKIESGQGNTSIYDIILQIHRTHKGK